MVQQRDTSRDEEIRIGVAAGDTLEAIGKRIGVCRERVRQIANIIIPIEVRKKAARDRVLVMVQCGQCGKEDEVKKWVMLGRKIPWFCCKGHMIQWMAWNHNYSRIKAPDGHWWQRNPYSRTNTRVERFIACRRLNRRLARNEWVRLKDGNPDNLSDDNIVIMSAEEVANNRKPVTHRLGVPLDMSPELLARRALGKERYRKIKERLEEQRKDRMARAALGRRAGAKRAANLSPERRKEIASKAARARWDKEMAS